MRMENPVPGVMKPRLIIFDLDGTLVDSSEDIANAINYAIRPFKIEPLTIGRTVDLIGEGLTRLVEKILGNDRMHLHAEVMSRFLEHYEEHLADHTQPYPGVPETLALLSEFQKAVVSNKRSRFSEKLLAELRLLPYFDLVIGSDSVPEKKPSPLPLIHVMQKLGAVPVYTLMVGDSPYDIQAGRAAGVRTVAVTYGYRGRGQLKDADIMLDDFREMGRLLGRA